MKRIMLPSISALAGCILAYVCWTLMQNSFRPRFAKPAFLKVASDTVIGPYKDFLGNSFAPNTLVEFADYQCPPCKLANQQIADILKSHPKTLRFAFRNYPLSFHPFALPAAIAAEAARQQHKFWPIHDALYKNQSSLSLAKIEDIIKLYNIDMSRYAYDSKNIARKAIADDTNIANDIQVMGTPTFVLCCSDKRVIRLTSLEQVGEFIK